MITSSVLIHVILIFLAVTVACTKGAFAFSTKSFLRMTFVVLCRRQTDEPMRMIRRLMGKLGLNLNEEKTRVVNTWQDRFGFLGFEMGIACSVRTGKPYRW